MPRTEQSAAWSDKQRVPDPRPTFDASEAQGFAAYELAAHDGSRRAVLISDTLDIRQLDMERALHSSAPPSFLIHMRFVAAPQERRVAERFQR